MCLTFCSHQAQNDTSWTFLSSIISKVNVSLMQLVPACFTHSCSPTGEVKTHVPSHRTDNVSCINWTNRDISFRYSWFGLSILSKDTTGHDPRWAGSRGVMGVVIVGGIVELLMGLTLCFRASRPSVDPPQLSLLAEPNRGNSDSWLRLQPQLSWQRFNLLVQHRLPPAVHGKPCGSGKGRQFRAQAHRDISLWLHQPESAAPGHLGPPVHQR